MKDFFQKRTFRDIKFPYKRNILSIATVLGFIGLFVSMIIFLGTGITKFYLNLIFIAMCLIDFLLTKDVIEEGIRRSLFILAKISIILFIFSIVNSIAYKAIYIPSFNLYEKAMEFGKGVNPTKGAVLFGIMFNFIALIVILYFYKNGELKDKVKEIYEFDIYSYFNKDVNSKKDEKKGEEKNFDLVLCKDSKTGKPIIIPHKDRFLHMLVLGPTGSGKTSQIILPAINQDMQKEGAGITVIEPKNDLAEKVYAMAQHYGRKDVMFFDPVLPDCPYFNPLYGPEEDVVENMATTFRMLDSESPQFFKDQNEILLRNSLKVLKRLYGNEANFIQLSTVIHNSGDEGRKIILQFSKLSAPNEAIAKENSDISSWFLNEYYNEKSKTYEHCSGLRSTVAKIISNKHLKRVLNPPGGKNDIDFSKHLEAGSILAITTNQGALGDLLSRFLGYFIILQFQSAVFKRPGNENTRIPHFLYIDEFQVYSNPGFANMLTQARTYRVASILATQNRALMAMGGGRDGKNFVELVSTNARNIVIFPGANINDAEYYSRQFGEIEEVEVQKTISRTKFDPFYGIQKINYPKESVREDKKLKPRFTPSDIIYRDFGEITYCIIQNNTVQAPAVGKIEYIPKELNDKLDMMIENFKANKPMEDEHIDTESKDMQDVESSEDFERKGLKNKKESHENKNNSTSSKYKDIVEIISINEENDKFTKDDLNFALHEDTEVEDEDEDKEKESDVLGKPEDDSNDNLSDLHDITVNFEDDDFDEDFF